MVPGIVTLGGGVRATGLEVDTLWSLRVDHRSPERVSMTNPVCPTGSQHPRRGRNNKPRGLFLNRLVRGRLLVYRNHMERSSLGPYGKPLVEHQLRRKQAARFWRDA
jgi:hypothetical protein